jgi:Leucine-rich repeat (LRR) protein
MNASEAYDEAMSRIDNAFERGSYELDLGDLDLSELPAELGSLTELKALTLGNRTIDEAEWWGGEARYEPYRYWFDNLDVIKPLQNLMLIGLGGCHQINDITPLAGMTNLKELDLSACGRLIDIEPLAYMPKLRALDLEQCKLVRDLRPLSKLYSLQLLNLRSRRKIS